MRTRQERVATDTRRSPGCRTTPLEHWSKRKPTVEPRWAKQQTKKLRCPSLSCPLDSLPPGGQANRGWLAPRGASCPGISYPRPGYLHPRGASCPGRFILPPAHTKKLLLCDVYYYLQHYNNYMQFLSYKYVNLNDYFQHSVGFLIDKGWGASCPGRFILPPRPEFQRVRIISNFYYIIYDIFS